jgi:hypothetical protein
MHRSSSPPGTPAPVPASVAVDYNADLA